MILNVLLNPKYKRVRDIIYNTKEIFFKTCLDILNYSFTYTKVRMNNNKEFLSLMITVKAEICNL